MTELIDQLGVALDQAEQIARAATPGPWRREHPDWPNTSIGNGGQTVIASAAGRGGSWPSAQDAAHITANGPTHVLSTIAAHREIVDEHAPKLDTVEWPHDQTGRGEALVCPRCQNADHTHWNPPIGGAGVLPEGFVAPYVLAPCRTLLAIAKIYGLERVADGDGPKLSQADSGS